MNEATTILMTIQEPLRFSREGRWFVGDVEVTHPGVAMYFTKHLRLSNTLRRFVIEVNGRAVDVKVEDTPRVVVRLAVEGGQLAYALNDGTEGNAAPDSLSVEGGENYYLSVPVDGGRARVLRNGVQAIAPFIEESEGKYYLCLESSRIPLERTSPIAGREPSCL